MFFTGFFAVFYCFADIFAEISGIDTRNFYVDWWNAIDLDEFWRQWNIPVHDWFKRHVFIESVYHFKLNKDMAMTLVFIISAVLH